MNNQELESNKTQNNEAEIQTPLPFVSELRAKEYLERIRLDQNLMYSIGASMAAACIGAVLWAVITVLIKYQIGYMAIGVGFIVGYSNRYVGKGIDQIFGVIGGAFALFGCILGNILSMIVFAAQAENMGYFEILPLIDYAQLPSLLIENGNFMDLLFYGLAIYEGYRFSFRIVTDEEISAKA